MPPAVLAGPSPWHLRLLSELAQDLTQSKTRLGSSFTSGMTRPCNQSRPSPWKLAPLDLDVALSDVQTVIDACEALQRGANADESSAMLLQLINLSHARMRDAPSPSASTVWRSIYTDACIVRALALSMISEHLQAISTLDHAIIIAGPCGEGRLDLVLDVIGRLQACMPADIPDIPTAPHPITTQTLLMGSQPCTIPSPQPPSLLAFQKTYSHAPFILRNYASEWPAVNNWKSASYLRSISGPGRVVPVEIGRDYRLGDWKQELMSWDLLLSALEFEDQPSSGSSTDLYYLAQHDLTKQFPSLRDDITLPDYLYASLTPIDHAEYRPPNNDDQIILNTWLGPQNTMSPAHTDPYYNFYVQVVGHKTVWLAPPSVSAHMQPPPLESEDGSDSSHFPSSALSNTSPIDVFAPERDTEGQPEFVKNVQHVSMTAVLNPGDMLFFPPGWWHAMKSESTSFSLSMWF